MPSQTDNTVLLDYLSSLLQAPYVAPEEQYCLKVMVASQALLLPLDGLGGIQAICGPLIKSTMNQWFIGQHSDVELLDLRMVLDLEPYDYTNSDWRGHSLKLKHSKQSVLVDQILGSQKSNSEHIWHQSNGFFYTLVSA